MDIHLNEMAGDILVFLTGEHSVPGLKILPFIRGECGTTLLCTFVRKSRLYSFYPSLVLCQEEPLEEKMTTHSRILAWKIPWTEEPGRLQSMGSLRVGHD